MHLDQQRLRWLIVLAVALAIGAWLAWATRSPQPTDPAALHVGDSEPNRGPELLGESKRRDELPPRRPAVDAGATVEQLRIRGACVDEWGKAVGGGVVVARVQLGSLEYATPDASTPVDDSGKFELSVQPVDVASIRLSYRRGTSLHSSFTYVDIPRAREGTESVTLVAYRTAVLDVEVVDWRGAPVANATVTAHPADLLLDGEVQCDQRGRCTVRMFAEPHCALRARSGSGAYGQTKALYLQPAEKRRVRVTLDKKLRRTAVRCVSSGGSLGGARVRVRKLHERAWADLVVDGEAGHIELPSAGRVTLVVDIVGVGRRHVRWKSIRDALASGELVITLEDLGRLELTIVDEHGGALPNLRLELGRELPSGDSQRVQVKRTDSAGVVAVGPLSHGAYRVRIPGHLDERLDLEARILRQTLTMTGASTIRGTYSGPAAVGGRRVSLVVTLGTGVVEQTWAPSGDEPARPWSVSLPMPDGAPFRVQALIGGQPAGPPIESVARSDVLVDTTPHVLRVRARSGDRQWLRGWVEVSPMDESSAHVRRTFIDSRDGFANFPMPPPGSYRVRHATQPVGGNGPWAGQVLHLKAGMTTVEVDVAP